MAFHENVFIDQERKKQVRKRLDTVVVASVNDLDLRLARVVNNLVSSFRETKVFVAQGEYGCKAET